MGTSWIHKITDCKSTCKCRTMLGATACDSSKHHKLFHGSNNAYVNVVHKFNLMKVDKPITELDLARTSPVLLQLQVVRLKGAQGLLMFDPGSNVSLITKSFAKSLGLKGINTTQLVQVAGHDPESWDTKAYTATLVDNNHGLHKAICFEVDTITSSMARVNITPVVHLFSGQNLKEREVRRHGEVNF